MTSLAVPEFGELCPICVEYFINKYNEDDEDLNLRELSEEDIENIWRNLGKIITHGGYTCPATRHMSSLEYNKHLELHSFGTEFITKVNFTEDENYGEFSIDSVYLRCAKCSFCPHANEPYIIEKVMDHFKIHQYFEEKLRDLPQCIHRWINFASYDYGFKFTPYVSCVSCQCDAEWYGTICPYIFTPKELLIHLFTKHFMVDAANLVCPCCREHVTNSDDQTWTADHKCFEIIKQLNEQYVVRPRRAMYAFLTHHKLERHSQEVDPSYLGMIDEDTARRIVRHMQ